MATVPTASDLGLGRQIKTELDTTPDPDYRPGDLIAAGRKDRAASLLKISEGIQSVATPINEAMIGIKKREDTIDRARKSTEFNTKATKLLQAAKDTSDLSLPDAMEKLNIDLTNARNTILGDHQGTAASIALLDAEFEVSSASFSSEAAKEGVKIQKQIISETLKEKLLPITAQALKEPGKILDYFAAWDKHIDSFRDGMDEVEEVTQLQAGRSAIVLNSIEAFTGRGNYLEAKKLIDENPAILQELDSNQQRSVITKIATGLAAQRKTNNAGNIKVQTAEQILGRKLTQPERVKLAGLTSTGTKTEAEKIKDIEESIGRLLTVKEKEVHAGLRAKPKATEQKFQTDVGQAFADVELAKKRFGEGSKAYKAIVEAAEDVEEKTQLSDVASLRKEYTKLSNDYILLRDAYAKIEVSATGVTSPAGDLALIFNFMKMLDPGSTVREGEFANAENAGNIPTRVWALYNKMFTSKGRLEDTQRADFLNRSKQIMTTQQRSQESLVLQFTRIAKSQKMKVDEVIIDFIGVKPNLEYDGAGDDGGPTVPVEIDLSGKPITPQDKPVEDENRPAESKPAEVKRDPKAKIDFSTMDAATLGQIDIKGMSKANKNALKNKLKELGL
jgi:hypothetical protein